MRTQKFENLGPEIPFPDYKKETLPTNPEIKKEDDPYKFNKPFDQLTNQEKVVRILQKQHQNIPLTSEEEAQNKAWKEEEKQNKEFEDGIMGYGKNRRH